MKKRSIKKILLLLLILGVYSCQDNEIAEVIQKTITEKQNESDFLVFSTRGELQNSILSLKRIAGSQVKDFATTRAAISVPIPENFHSLLESNKERCLSKLTVAQLDSVKNDPDQLEFCLSDSVIADYEFAQLLNADRMIQVEGKIYRYFPNCVAYTDARNAQALKELPLQLKPAETESELRIGANSEGTITIIRNKYEQEEAKAESPEKKGDLKLKNGVIIPSENIREVNYKTSGDGGWLHKLWNGLWGKNVLAIKKFNGHKRLRLGFYDQNYILYANIGTTLKMQKKVCGIWWNCKADEMRLGWSAIELKTTFKSPFKKYLENMDGIKDDEGYPTFMAHDFPFNNEKEVLLHIPFVSYDLKVKDINSLLKQGIKQAMKKGYNTLEELVRIYHKVGIYSSSENVVYSVSGPDEQSSYNVRTFDKKFYSKWFPGTFRIGITYNGKINIKDFQCNDDGEPRLGRGIVYGAVKYKGSWLAARITKDEI